MVIFFFVAPPPPNTITQHTIHQTQRASDCQQTAGSEKAAGWAKLTEEARNGRKRRPENNFRAGVAIVGCFTKATTNDNMELLASTVRIAGTRGSLAKGERLQGLEYILCWDDLRGEIPMLQGRVHCAALCQ